MILRPQVMAKLVVRAMARGNWRDDEALRLKGVVLKALEDMDEKFFGHLLREMGKANRDNRQFQSDQSLYRDWLDNPGTIVEWGKRHGMTPITARVRLSRLRRIFERSVTDEREHRKYINWPHDEEGERFIRDSEG